MTVGAAGSVRSMRTVLPESGTLGTHGEVKPATSVERNWTSVSPCAVIVAAAPGCALLHVVPPSADVRYW